MMKKEKKIKYGIIFIVGIIAISLSGISMHSILKNVKENKNSNPVNNESKDNFEYLEVKMIGDYQFIKPEDLFMDADVVVMATYQTDEKIEMVKNSRAYTTSKFKITKVLKNDTNLALEDYVNVAYGGGIISLKEYLATQSKEQITTNGFDHLTEEKINNTKVKFIFDSEMKDTNLKKSADRILFLRYVSEENKYLVISDFYGMISYNKDTLKAYDNYTENFETFSFLK